MKHSDLPYAARPACTLDIHLPEIQSEYTFLYFHGGGIEGGDKSEADETAIGEALTREGIAFVSANYRLYPEAHYPEFIEDAAEAVRFVKENSLRYGLGKKLFVGGSSAGAYIAMMLCFDAKYGIQPLDIAGFVFDAGQPTVHFNVLKEDCIDPRKVVVDERAPLYHVGEAQRYPKMLFFAAEDDIPSRPQQTELMLSTLNHFGHRDLAEYHFMKGYAHCAYTGTEVFNGIVNRFIKEIGRNIS